MTLILHNTLTRQDEPFVPLDPAHVRLYVCGPTVYDYAHIGNARPVVVFDVLARLLRRLYPRVTYVRNITDVDDKILAAAQESGEPIDSITARTAAAFHDDMARLGALDPDMEPRATRHIPQMVAMIGRLVEAGHAYPAEGHVLFHVPSMPTYGRLSKRDREDLVAGARVEVAPYKRDPADFVLWKPSAEDQPGWDSPWGRGRPGWHIECSAMSAEHLGETFDIHGGGQDLIFPHHENEIAQSTCAHGTPFMAKTWVHNGYVTVNGEKMSKSLGNFFTVHDLVEEFAGREEAIRLALLSGHYRQPLDFTREGVRQAKAALDRLYGALRRVRDLRVEPAAALPEGVRAALEQDLNTPAAIARLHELAGQLNKAESQPEQMQLKRELLAGGAVLGLLQADPEAWMKGVVVGVSGSLEAGSAGVDGEAAVAGEDSSEADIQRKIDERIAARKAKDFKKADEIRAELADRGIILEDKPGGVTEWRRAG
jgi:cysteinyl-tRNA synthetase